MCVLLDETSQNQEDSRKIGSRDSEIPPTKDLNAAMGFTARLR